MRVGEALLGCDRRQLLRSVARRRSGKNPPIIGHEQARSAIPKAASRLLAKPDIQLGGRE